MFSHHHQSMDIRTTIQAEIESDGGTENSSSLCKPVPNNENTHKGVCTDFFSMISSKTVNHLACDLFFFFRPPSFSLYLPCVPGPLENGKHWHWKVSLELGVESHCRKGRGVHTSLRVIDKFLLTSTNHNSGLSVDLGNVLFQATW